MMRGKLTDLDILEIARRAVERRRKKKIRKCEELVNRWGLRYVRQYVRSCAEILEDPYSFKVFLKSDFIVCARSYLRKNRLVVKVETLLRRLRKLAEVQKGIRYVNKRKGLYELIEE